jgi:ubiquitin-protein ligase
MAPGSSSPPPPGKAGEGEGEGEVVVWGGVQSEEALEAEYQRCLGELRVTEGDDEVFEGHRFSALEEDPPQEKLLRLAAELGTLKDSLPCSIHSMACICVHEEHCDWMKVLIAGAQGTPYESGLFEYHLQCPGGAKPYPETNPSCVLATTGEGKIRFNPNLYNCGKVCLTLLGTWRGAPGEGWTKASSLHQLIISISAMVMTDEPHYNEPGFEQEAGTAQGNARNNGYINKVRWGTCKYAMRGQLEHPSAGFEDVIREHFRIKAGLIRKQLDGWLEEARAQEEGDVSYSHSQDSFSQSWNKATYVKLLAEEVAAVHAALDALETSPCD